LFAEQAQGATGGKKQEENSGRTRDASAHDRPEITAGREREEKSREGGAQIVGEESAGKKVEGGNGEDGEKCRKPEKKIQQRNPREVGKKRSEIKAQRRVGVGQVESVIGCRRGQAIMIGLQVARHVEEHPAIVERKASRQRGHQAQ